MEKFRFCHNRWNGLFFEAKWVKYKISLTQPWSHQKNKLQGKSADIESICCSTGAWSWGDSKYFGSLWSWRGWRGRWCGWFTLNSQVVQITPNISDDKTMQKTKHVYPNSRPPNHPHAFIQCLLCRLFYKLHKWCCKTSLFCPDNCTSYPWKTFYVKNSQFNHSGSCCTKRRPSAASREPFCQHDERWARFKCVWLIWEIPSPLNLCK